MIRDYSVYELNKREKIIVFSGGYFCLSVIAFLFYHSLFLSFAGGFAAWFLFKPAALFLARRRATRLNVQFKDLLDSLSASVAAGRQMEEALLEAYSNLSLMYGDGEPIMKELAHIRRCIRENKESDRTLLLDLASRSGSEDINNFVQVYVTCRTMGGDLEKIITNAAEIITEKMNIDREIHAITAQKKFEGRLIAVMPLAMLLFLNLLSGSYIEVLYVTLAGRLVMTLCLAAMAYGVYLMEKLSTIEL